jgi:hypothetical protein
MGNKPDDKNIGGAEDGRNPEYGPLMSVRDAARYIGMSRRWLESCPDLKPIDLAKPGARRRVPRWSKRKLDEYIASRLDPKGRAD